MKVEQQWAKVRRNHLESGKWPNLGLEIEVLGLRDLISDHSIDEVAILGVAWHHSALS